jgi:hypothetical protein
MFSDLNDPPQAACHSSYSSDLGQVREKLDQDLEEVEIDHERKHYEAGTCHDCGSCCGSVLAGG